MNRGLIRGSLINIILIFTILSDVGSGTGLRGLGNLVEFWTKSKINIS